MYQQINLADHSLVGAPRAVPDCLQDLSDAQLADLDAFSDPAPTGFAGQGFWPVDVSTPSYDATKLTPTGGLGPVSANVVTKRCAAAEITRDLTATELASNLLAARTSLANSVDAKRDAILAGGFAYDFGGTIGPQVLQTRDQDTTNWLTLQSTCLAAVTAGQGATQGATIRTLANVNVALSYADGLKVMLALAAWGAAVYANSWTLKDRIAAVADQSGLTAIDVTAGWPAGG